MKCVQMLILLLNPEAVDGGALLEGTNLISALGSSSQVGFTRIPGPHRLLLCSCVTLVLSLTLSDLSFLKAMIASPCWLLRALNVTAHAHSLGNQC